MSFMTPQTITRATAVRLALVLTAASLTFSATAAASSIVVTATPNPSVSGATVTLTNTGVTNPEAPLASNQVYDYAEANAAPCAPTAADARTRSGGSGYITTLQIVQNPQFSFELQTPFRPIGAANTWRICAYLYTGGDDSVAPDAVGTVLLSIPPTRAQLLARALKKCHRLRSRSRRAKCVSAAKRRYAAKR